MTRRAMAGGKKGNQAVAQVKQPAAPAAFLPLAPFVVNLADTDRSSFLKVEITLGLGKALPAANGEAAQSPLTPEVRDTILSVLTTWQSTQLLASDGKARLKEQILKAVERRVPQLEVMDVYFTDFLIQQ